MELFSITVRKIFDYYQHLLAEVRDLSFRPQGEIYLVISQISQSLRSFEMTSFFCKQVAGRVA